MTDPRRKSVTRNYFGGWEGGVFSRPFISPLFLLSLPPRNGPSSPAERFERARLADRKRIFGVFRAEEPCLVAADVVTSVSVK